MSEKASVDWERIELDYRAGVLTLREIATRGGVTHTAVGKAAKKHGWTRDLSAKIKARAEELVSKAEVSSSVSKQAEVSERQAIEANATAIADIVVGHKGSSRRGVALGMSLMAELEAEGADLELFAKLGEIMANPDDPGAADKLNEAYRKATSLPGRASTYKTIIEGLKNAIAMQRQAWGITDDAAGGGSGGFEKMLAEIHGAVT